MHKSVKICLPFDIRLSKNNRLRSARLGFIPKEVKQIRDSFALAIRAYAHEFRNAKALEVGLMVHKPDNRSDAQNFVDELSDIIQLALGTNDRNFRFSQVDGNVRPGNPEFEITISEI